MIILRGLLSRKELFRLLFKLKGKEEELSVLWLEGGKSFEYKGLKVRKVSYFSLLLEGRKTLKDLILEGYLSEYPFSRVIRKSIFVPKLRGDLYYWAYLSKGFGRQVYVEGYEEFEEKVKKLKRETGFIDPWEVEEIKVGEEVIVFPYADSYPLSSLAPLFNLLLRHRSKVLVLTDLIEKKPLEEYFSFTRHRIVSEEEKSLDLTCFSFELVKTRYDFLDMLETLEKPVVICEGSVFTLIDWALRLMERGISFGVQGDYKGEDIYLSLPSGVFRAFKTGFIGASVRAGAGQFLRAVSKIERPFLSSEDLLLWGYFQSFKLK